MIDEIYRKLNTRINRDKSPPKELFLPKDEYIEYVDECVKTWNKNKKVNTDSFARSKHTPTTYCFMEVYPE